MAEIGLNGLATAVHCAIQINPPSSYLYICLISPPGTVNWTFERLPQLFEIGGVADHPAENGARCDEHAELPGNFR